MADIDVVPKKGGAGWMIWVVAALVVVGVLWFLMRGNNEPDRDSYRHDFAEPSVSMRFATSA